MSYDTALDAALQRLHDEGRYRTFIDIERRKGQFPHAVWTRPDESFQDIEANFLRQGRECGEDGLQFHNFIVIELSKFVKRL